MKFLKVIGIVLIGLFVLAFIGSMMDPASPAPKTKEELAQERKERRSAMTEEEKQLEDQRELDTLKTQLKSAVSFHTKGFEPILTDHVTGLHANLIILASNWNLAERGLNSGNPEAIKLAKSLKAKLQHTQKKVFPKLRKQFAKIAYRTMWEQDIDVSISNNNRTLDLVGGVFAANKNKAEVEGIIAENLNTFRFKRSTYRWYKGADEYTYYTIDSPKDTDPVEIPKTEE